jgi:hypothetical protein
LLNFKEQNEILGGKKKYGAPKENSLKKKNLDNLLKEQLRFYI